MKKRTHWIEIWNKNVFGKKGIIIANKISNKSIINLTNKSKYIQTDALQISIVRVITSPVGNSSFNHIIRR